MSESASPRPRWFTATPEGHSTNYVERFRALADQGADLDGEARFVDTLAGRGSRILDAGCGAGRVAGALHAVGHQALGLDVDPVLIEAAETDHPGPTYAVADLSELTLDDVGDEPVDLTVCAGNVMVFLAPGTEQQVLRNLCAVTRAGGRVVLGFRRDEVYPFTAFDDDLTALARDGVADFEQRFATWHLDPFTDDADFAVTVLRVR
ncbi:class I SAM-dependent methyltransferase [Nocardioides yefusunii]|uniref:Class I SAM-dependent methyltransferase n=1 Tax=Nocardioides yefusunii TaxID=2500546 RepID=A0ABW1QUU0_9ACTN|nr:class I SAM-dependent methyltransferase [Nocardioides yefusunii]